MGDGCRLSEAGPKTAIREASGCGVETCRTPNHQALNVDFRPTACASADAVTPPSHTSRITGVIRGRRDVCLFRNRFRSERIFSFMTPQSVRSSCVDVSSVRATT
jgi:hypothetical protein